MNRVWTMDKLHALKKLADLSTVYRPNGVPLPRKDWTSGLTKLQSQDHQAYKLLKAFPLAQLKWSWSKYQNVVDGYCATSTCTNKIEPGEYYCPTCKPGGTGYHRGVFSVPCVKENIDVVKKTLAEYSEKDLRNIIVAGVDKMSYTLRKELLGDNFKKLLSEKESKKKK